MTVSLEKIEPVFETITHEIEIGSDELIDDR
jgi:hypothetical protein